MSYDYDFFVIGAGSGGVRAGRVASQLGAKVAIAEDRYLGGTCVNVGCVPKKLFVFGSEYARMFAEARGFGWQSFIPDFDWSRLRDNTAEEVSRLNGIYRNILENAGLNLIEGRARLAGPNSVVVEGKTYTAKYILIAVGGWPRRPDFPGQEHAVDSNKIFSLSKLPDTLLIQGGGYVAVEFAGIFNGLGVNTELVYRKELFLRGFDNEVRQFVRDEIANSGVTLSFNVDIDEIEDTGNGYQVSLTNGQSRFVDLVMTAVGRIPHTHDLGIENTQINFGVSGEILVDHNFQTDEPSIYAIGDVVGRKALTPVALAEGMALAHHLFDRRKIDLDYQNIATAVFSQPNIGTVGISEEDAIASGGAFDIYTTNFRPLRSMISGASERTMMKMVVDAQTKKVVGAHMVGPDAGEIMQGIAIAVNAGLTKDDFDKTIGIHPSIAEEFVTMRTPARTIGAES